MRREWQIRDRIAGQYEIYQILGGEGHTGMGVVYICYNHKHKMPYALKTFQDRCIFSQEAQKAFEKEALIWTKLERHPNIVRAFWVEKLENRLFIILEYIAPDHEGRNILTHYLGRLSFVEMLKISIQFCYGIEYAYSKGIDAHRDIKPDNIMITQDKTVKITDFGIAKAFQELKTTESIVPSAEKDTLSVFASGGKRICGTLPYISPEQFDGHADERSDIYSFGITLYQMLANGNLPFYGQSIEEYEDFHRCGKIPVISSPLFSIIQKCLRKKPELRFQDFSSLRKEFQKLLLHKTGEELNPPVMHELEAWELTGKGFALNTLGRYHEAISCFDEAIKINNGDTIIWVDKGMALSNLGRYHEAISCFDEALRINPLNYYAWYDKGANLSKLGKYQEALVYCDEALGINRHFADAWNTKGIALGSLGRYQEALVCFDEALRINREFADAWGNKGAALCGLGRYQEGIVCCDEAIRINPIGDMAWYNKALALYQISRYHVALQSVEEAIRLNPTAARIELKKLIIAKLEQ